MLLGEHAVIFANLFRLKLLTQFLQLLEDIGESFIDLLFVGDHLHELTNALGKSVFKFTIEGFEVSLVCLGRHGIIQISDVCGGPFLECQELSFEVFNFFLQLFEGLIIDASTPTRLSRRESLHLFLQTGKRFGHFLNLVFQDINSRSEQVKVILIKELNRLQLFNSQIKINHLLLQDSNLFAATFNS